MELRAKSAESLFLFGNASEVRPGPCAGPGARHTRRQWPETQEFAFLGRNLNHRNQYYYSVCIYIQNYRYTYIYIAIYIYYVNYIMLYYIISYYIISYHIILYYIKSYHIISYYIILYYIQCNIICAISVYKA